MGVEVREVALDVERPAAGRLDPGPYWVVVGRRMKVGVGDVAAGCSELDGDGRADAAQAAGDER